MLSDSVWIVGPSRSGKTTCLVEQFCAWVQSNADKQGQVSGGRQMRSARELLPQRLKGQPEPAPAAALSKLNIQQNQPAVLVLAANDDNRTQLADRIIAATEGRYPISSKTPLGFFQDEVILFWPLLIQLLNLRAQFPVRLRPETEQELATRLWHPLLDSEISRLSGVSEYRLVRRILDLLQLAAYSGTPTEELSGILEQGLIEEGAGGVEPQLMVSLLLQWRSWCLERGLLTYGIITELYWKHLLPDPDYQRHLTQRYGLVLADDVDDYPSVTRHLFEFLLNQGAVGAFTYNPNGAVRLGLGADPEYLAGLQELCQVKIPTQTLPGSLIDTFSSSMVELVTDPMALLSLPEAVQSLQTTSRAALLRQTAEVIVQLVRSEQVQPQEVAVIAPGLDAIARYTLVEILNDKGIAVQPLNDQRPLNSSPVIRALLTLLALVYPGLGRLVDRDAVAEMLIVLSGGVGEAGGAGGEGGNLHIIDPVRAGLLADYCFEPHPEHPNLLPVAVYDRWDRLGYAATTAYGQILQWLEVQRSQQEQRLLPSPISLLDRAIQQFLWKGNNSYEQLAALRELLETAQHYWEVDARLRQQRSLTELGDAQSTTVAQFIQLLRRGTITANPYPVRSFGRRADRAVTLATIFQYRSSRRYHRWQFWLDAGSALWLSGGAATLFAAPLFLQARFGRPWTAEDAMNADEQRLQRILRDLLARVGARVYLCHSDLAVNGQEQIGPLLSLVNASTPFVTEPASSF